MSGKKKRMSMLDNLAAAGAPAPPSSMLSTNRALRSARDAVDGHKVWDLDPASIDTTGRMQDRLDMSDVADLQDAIEANGQTVPILVRRHPEDPDRYLLVYGYRRLVAIQQSDKVDKVRALIATLDDRAAQQAQISENMARRDLSYIEKARFARQLVEGGFGSQTEVAEVLTVAKSSISMAFGILDMVGEDLVLAIGPAHGIGRPRWEALGKLITDHHLSRTDLVDVATRSFTRAEWSDVLGEAAPPSDDPSVAAFEAVLAEAQALVPAQPIEKKQVKRKQARRVQLDPAQRATVTRTAKGLRFDISEGAFADWLEDQADTLLADLHARWQTRAEDPEQ
ncbi:plasmid partitioning protein RepB [Dinoroseobacter sp. S124A]|uniref:plasmid partitioning protein RepB n=1 Tax=Dinoroseobacter sp. S124A TaxID=3415128 RepID=UPI003C7E9BF7